MQSARELSVITSYNGTNLTKSFNTAGYALLMQQTGLEVRTSASLFDDKCEDFGMVGYESHAGIKALVAV